MTTMTDDLAPRDLRRHGACRARAQSKAERVWSYWSKARSGSAGSAAATTFRRHRARATRTAFNHNIITDEKPPEKYKRFDGTPSRSSTFTEQVLEFDPPRRLQTGFAGTGGQAPSEVLYELKPEGDNTRLIITHSKLPDRKEMIGVGAGWNSHLDVLADEFAGRRNKDFWTKHADTPRCSRSAFRSNSVTVRSRR